MSSPKSVSSKIPTRGLGFRRDGVNTNVGGKILAKFKKEVFVEQVLSCSYLEL